MAVHRGLQVRGHAKYGALWKIADVLQVRVRGYVYKTKKFIKIAVFFSGFCVRSGDGKLRRELGQLAERGASTHRHLDRKRCHCRLPPQPAAGRRQHQKLIAGDTATLGSLPR